jgi:NDP-sugar pyrophosphorylase family protein
MKINLSNYKAVILAGGAGTRLYPITKQFPKPLLPIKRKPILNYLIELFYSYSIKDIAILINHDFREDFDWWKKRYYPRNKIKIFEEKKPLGTFGGLWYLKKWISNNSFFLSNGDELKKIDLLKMAEFHQKIKPIGTIALVKVPNPQEYGVVLCKKGLVQKFLEKPKSPPSKYINSGLYLLSSEIFNYHPGPKFLMTEKDIFPKLAKEKKLAGFKFKGRWMDTGTWERYSKAFREWK